MVETRKTMYQPERAFTVPKNNATETQDLIRRHKSRTKKANKRNNHCSVQTVRKWRKTKRKNMWFALLPRCPYRPSSLGPVMLLSWMMIRACIKATKNMIPTYLSFIWKQFHDIYATAQPICNWCVRVTIQIALKAFEPFVMHTQLTSLKI